MTKYGSIGVRALVTKVKAEKMPYDVSNCMPADYGVRRKGDEAMNIWSLNQAFIPTDHFNHVT